MFQKIWQDYQLLTAQAPDLPGVEIQTNSEVAFLRSCFHNYTPQNAHLRLTPQGHVILKNMYEYWQFQLTDTDLHMLQQGKWLLHLQNHMKAPYYWDRRHFYVYHSEHALEYQLVSQDFSAWLRSL